MNQSKIIGKYFAGVKVLNTVRTLQPSGKYLTKYKVLCAKCGNESIKTKHQLDVLQGDGCPICSKRPNKKITFTISERNYKNYKSKINKQTKLSFDLSFEEFNNLTKKDCVYCGAKPSFPIRFKKEFKNREVEHFNGIDRIDPSIGYTVTNCVACCTKCNRMKSDFSLFEFLNHVKAIYNFNKSSTTSLSDVALSSGEMEEILTDNAEDHDIV